VSTRPIERRARSLRALGLLPRLAAVTIVGLALLGAALSVAGYLREQERVVDEARILARAAAADVDRYVRSRFSILTTIAASPSFVSNDLVRMQAFLDAIDEEAAGFDGGIAWIDPSGSMRVRTDYSGPPLDLSDRDYVQAILRTGEPYAGSARSGAVDLAPIVPIGVPSRDAAGRISGVVAGALRLDRAEIASEPLDEAAGIEVDVLDRSNTIVAGPERIDRVFAADPAFPLSQEMATSEAATYQGRGPLGSEDRLIGYAVAPSADWLVLVDRPAGAAFAPARAALAAQLGALALATLAALVLLAWEARRIARHEHERESAYRAEESALASERALRLQLEAAVTELQARGMLRDAFIGVLSHELRTPVTTIYGAAQLLGRPGLDGQRETLLEDIREESDRLVRITEDLLVLSRAERGALEIAPEPVLVQRLIPLVVAEVGRRFPGTPIEVVMAPDLAPVAADEGPLRQILGNLLTNAAKYAAGAATWVRAEQRGSVVLIVVEDDGPGFAEPERHRLFDLFYRSASTPQATAGTGIGLYVVRQLVEAMGGSVEALPGPRGGARFEVRLPVADEDEEAAAGGADVAVSPSGSRTELRPRPSAA
jgi:signal transduction histidine kinase